MINTSEFMIGDWVINEHIHEAEKVLLVAKDYFYVQHGEMSNYVLKAHNASPIPITDEILSRNGFLNSSNDIYVEKYFGNYNILYKGVLIEPLKPIKYLHELRRVLQVNGIAEADTLVA